MAIFLSMFFKHLTVENDFHKIKQKNQQQQQQKNNNNKTLINTTIWGQEERSELSLNVHTVGERQSGLAVYCMRIMGMYSR